MMEGSDLDDSSFERKQANCKLPLWENGIGWTIKDYSFWHYKKIFLQPMTVVIKMHYFCILYDWTFIMNATYKV